MVYGGGLENRWVKAPGVRIPHLPHETERCPRGRRGRFAKPLYWKRYRGFESLSLRMEKLKVYWQLIIQYSRILYAKITEYYKRAKTFCFEHKREILLSVAYVPYIGWLYPLYAYEHDEEVQKHAKRALLYAVVAVAMALAIFTLLFMMPRPWRLLRFIFTMLLYINYFLYYAIVTVHIYCIWNKKDFSIATVENYLEKLEQYI